MAKPVNPRDIVRGVLPRNMAKELWSARYEKALPITSNSFELSAVLPAVLYMFRYGRRRGTGEFLKTFVPEGGTPPERRRKATVERVAKALASSADLHGFDGQVEQAVLGDLLLCFCLENANRRLGRDQQIQRVAAAHYLASWVDLPERVTALRSVPEMIVAMLANQYGNHVVPTHLDSQKTWFAVARGAQDNVLLRAFSQGVAHRGGPLDDTASDRFDENQTVGLDQLLMIRLAQQLPNAPDRPRGNETEKISNQRPIAEQTAEHFSEDIRLFVRAYAATTPRYIFIDMLESCMSTGMTAILTSVIEILFAWSDTGAVPPKHEQRPASIFVDCSNGVDTRLRGLAEHSMDDFMRRVERVPVVLMMLRLLDYTAKHNRKIKKQQISTLPYATRWLNLLGDIMHRRHEEAPFIHRTMDDYCEALADALDAEYPDATEVLRNDASEPNSIRRLAAGLTPLLGSSHRGNLLGMVDSTLQVGRPNGLAHKRLTTRGASSVTSGRRRREVRSLHLTDAGLDYLVHLHVLSKEQSPKQRRISLRSFIDTIRKRYGFHVDAAPEGMTISNQLLEVNRTILERRLRDLGLLVGVNDAEAMKRLKPRFPVEDGCLP